MWAANPSVSTGPLLFIFCLPVPYEEFISLDFNAKKKKQICIYSLMWFIYESWIN